MMRPPIGLPLPMPRGGPMDGPYRFQHQGPVILPGGPPGMSRPPMQISLGPRGPVPGGQMVLGRMPGAPPPVFIRHNLYSSCNDPVCHQVRMDRL